MRNRERNDERKRNYPRDRARNESSRNVISGNGNDYSRDFGNDYNRDFGSDYREMDGNVAGNYDRDFRQVTNRERGGMDLSMGRFGGISGDNYREPDSHPFRDEPRSESFFGRAKDFIQRGLHSGKGPKGWRRSDERIHEDVCEALYHSAEVDASEIEVSVKEGNVYLRGSVQTRDEKREAERCVENLSGVSDVQNELQLHRHQGRSQFKQTNVS